MQVKTGNGPVSIMVVIAIWSLSLAVNLPGLAVTPIEGSLRSIFTDATDFKIQLLTVLPNLVIIPFVLLSGKLSESNHKVTVIITGTVMFLVSGLLSIFTSSLTVLIFLSCLLGAGCGLILPFSTGLIADVFTGKYRVRQMGIISAIGNISLVAATFAVGFLVADNLMHTWHRAFIVYLIPVLSLVLIPFLYRIPRREIKEDGGARSVDSGATDKAATPSKDYFPVDGQTVKGGFYVGRTIWLLLAYFIFIFINCVPCYYLPNISWVSSEDASSIISTFYFAMFVMGMGLTQVLKIFGKSTFIFAMGLITVGLGIYIFVHGNFVAYIVASVLCGMGNGIAQPVFYTKATELVNTERKSTLALAFVQVANYVAISLVPVIISAGEGIFHTRSAMFPFIFAGVTSVIVLAVIILRRRHFVFGISPRYY